MPYILFNKPYVASNKKASHSSPANARFIPPPRRPLRPKPVPPHGPTAWIKINLREEKKRQTRHITAAVGLFTLRLVRVAIGRIKLADLQVGQWRYLTPEEIKSLQK